MKKHRPAHAAAPTILCFSGQQQRFNSDSIGRNTHRGARTHDLKVKGLALYRLSLAGYCKTSRTGRPRRRLKVSWAVYPHTSSRICFASSTAWKCLHALQEFTAITAMTAHLHFVSSPKSGQRCVGRAHFRTSGHKDTTIASNFAFKCLMHQAAGGFDSCRWLDLSTLCSSGFCVRAGP